METVWTCPPQQTCRQNRQNVSPGIALRWKTFGLDLFLALGLNRRRGTKGDYYVLAVGPGRGRAVPALRWQTLLWKLRLVYTFLHTCVPVKVTLTAKSSN